MEHFKGTSSHSHNYREPSSFAGKKVVIVGASNSGEDIAQEVSTVADTVVMCASYYLRPEWGNPGSAATGPRRNIFRWPRISRVVDTGDIELQGVPQSLLAPTHPRRVSLFGGRKCCEF